MIYLVAALWLAAAEEGEEAMIGWREMSVRELERLPDL